MYDDYVTSVRPMNLGREPYFDGVYYQLQSPSVIHSRRRTVRDMLQHRNIGGMTLQQYQDFVELDWLRPHGEFKTVLKMEEHLIGEHQEFVEANRGHRSKVISERIDKLKYDDTKKVVSELGDILWFFNAQSVNGVVNVQDSWKTYLHTNDMRLSSQPTIRSVDEVIELGHRPRIGIFESGHDDISVDLLFAAGFICIGTKIILEEHNEENFNAMQARQQNVGMWLAYGIGLIAKHAEVVGSSFSNVIEENIRKTSLRAERRTLSDKVARSVEEL